MEQKTKHSISHFLSLPHWGSRKGLHIGILACCLIGTFAFTSCDLSDTRDQLASISFTTFSVSVVYSDTTYTFTYNGDTVQYNQSYYIPLQILRKDSVGVLRAYKSKTLELDTTLHVSPIEAFTFIQLPGEKIKFYDASAAADEPAPTDSTCTKARFIYKADYHAADSLRFVWMSSTKASLSLPGATAPSFDTIVMHKGKLSPYVEFDTDKYKAAGSNTYFYYTRQTWNGTAWTGSTKTAMGTITGATYKFATFQLGTSEWKFLFGSKWK
ncbi:MAG: hypothetical protein QM751_03985 [Paludibacteraceae bacterium]